MVGLEQKGARSLRYVSSATEIGLLYHCLATTPHNVFANGNS